MTYGCFDRPPLKTSAVVADGWQSYTRELSATDIITAFPTAAYIRGRLWGGRNAGGTDSGATWQAAFVRLRDITEVTAAQTAATAAAGSACPLH